MRLSVPHRVTGAATAVGNASAAATATTTATTAAVSVVGVMHLILRSCKWV